MGKANMQSPKRTLMLYIHTLRVYHDGAAMLLPTADLVGAWVSILSTSALQRDEQTDEQASNSG